MERDQHTVVVIGKRDVAVDLIRNLTATVITRASAEDDQTRRSYTRPAGFTPASLFLDRDLNERLGMSYPQKLILAASLFASGWLIVGGASDAVADRPNIVFIYADDLGFGDLASHGHPVIRTPNLDRLADQGTDFHQFTVVNPVCSPSRAAILTGQFPSRLGIHQHFATVQSNRERGMPDWLDPTVPMLPRILKGAGYRTAHYGKWHLTGGGIEDAPTPDRYGYDDAATYTGGGRHVFAGTPYAAMTSPSAAHDQHAASYLSVAATDHAIEFIRRSGESPFYINLWLHETHALVTATEEQKAAYANVDEPQRTYYAAVTRADDQVGRIMTVLDELNLADNTIVVFSSDNGPENANSKVGHKLYHSRGATGDRRGRKRSLLMGGVNVPMIVRWPGKVPAGRVDKTTAMAGVDVMPTLLQAAGVDAPANLVADGESVLAAWTGESFRRTKPVFWFWQGHHGGDDWPAWAMRDGRWTLVVDETKQRRELYDVVSDPSQSQDVASENANRVAEMMTAIETWFETIPESVDPALQSSGTVKRKSSPSKPKSGSRKPLTKADRARIFGIKDTDGDRRLSLSEFSVRLPSAEEAKTRFDRFDRNDDQTLTLEEFSSAP